jgi:hypothetical protein
MTWQIMLSLQDKYEGGGTYISDTSTNYQTECRPGRYWSIQEIFTIEVAVHITCGERLLIVSFMDGFNPQIYDESVKEDNIV